MILIFWINLNNNETNYINNIIENYIMAIDGFSMIIKFIYFLSNNQFEVIENQL